MQAVHVAQSNSRWGVEGIYSASATMSLGGYLELSEVVANAALSGGYRPEAVDQGKPL